METIDRILVPFDFSEASLNALEYVRLLVDKRPSVDILALYVSSMPIAQVDREKLQGDFDRVLESIPFEKGTVPKFQTATGGVIDCILAEQKALGADLILMGTMGDKVTDEAITNTSRLVLDARCPVLAVPYGCPIKEPANAALVLVGKSRAMKRMPRPFLALAGLFGSKLHLMTKARESQFGEGERSAKLLPDNPEPFYEVTPFGREGDMETGVLEYIQKAGIDLLAIVPENHTEGSTPSQGRLTRLLTLHAEVPVLSLGGHSL